MTLTARFATLINGLWRVVAGHQGGGVHPQRMDPAVINLVYHHLKSIAKRFAALCARVDAGTLPTPLPTPTPTKPATLAKPRATPKPFPQRLPGIHGWLRSLSNPTHHTNIEAGYFEQFFQDPEFRALAARAPQLRRILRPLCTMLGIELPDPAPEPRKQRARPFWPINPHRPDYSAISMPPLRFKIV